MDLSLEERIARIYYEFDCPKCFYTNFRRQVDYEDGEVIQCGQCGHKFTEYDDQL